MTECVTIPAVLEFDEKKQEEKEEEDDSMLSCSLICCAAVLRHRHMLIHHTHILYSPDVFGGRFTDDIVCNLSLSYTRTPLVS